VETRRIEFILNRAEPTIATDRKSELSACLAPREGEPHCNGIAATTGVQSGSLIDPKAAPIHVSN